MIKLVFKGHETPAEIDEAFAAYVKMMNITVDSERQTYCNICNRTSAQHDAYKTHLKSAVHKRNVCYLLKLKMSDFKQRPQ